MIEGLLAVCLLVALLLCLKVRTNEKLLVSSPLRDLMISQIRDSKNWRAWDTADPDLDGIPPILEQLSDSDLLEQYDYYVCGVR